MSRDSGLPLTEAQRRLARDPEALLMVERLADRHVRRYGLLIARDDLVTLGRIGVSEAARTYRTDSGVSFADFAWSHANGRMMNAIGKETAYQKALREGVDRCVETERDEAAPLRDTEEDERNALQALSERILAAGMLGVIGEASRVSAAGGEAEIAERDTLAHASAALSTAVAALPETARDIIRLHYHEGRTLAEIVDDVGLPNYTAVRREHKQSLQRLAVLLRALGVSRAPRRDGT